MPPRKHISERRNSDRESGSDSFSSDKGGRDIRFDSSFSEEVEEDEDSIKENLHNNNFIGKNYIQLALGIAAIVIVIAVFVIYRKSVVQQGHANVEEALKKALLLIREKFPSQEKGLWMSIYSVLVTVSKSSCPRVVLLLDRGDALTKATSKCLVSMVAEKSAQLLPSQENKPLRLSDNDLNCVDCIPKQRERVKNHGTVIIENLEKFPSQTAGSLHFFCDEYDPDFAKAIYLLTMSVHNAEIHATKAAEMAFKALWQAQMKEEELDALVSRLTSQVVFVKPEKNLPCNQ